MKIVVLDGYVLNPGDLGWDGLKKLGDCTIYDRTSPELTPFFHAFFPKQFSSTDVLLTF